MTPLAFIDIETTGLSPLHHAVIEIGMILDFGECELFSEKVIEYSWRCRPLDGKLIDPDALAVNRFTQAQIMQWDPPLDTWKKIQKVLVSLCRNRTEAPVFVSYGAFDYDFLTHWCNDLGVKLADYFQKHILDIKALAAALNYIGVWKGKGIKLKDAALAYANHVSPAAHTALEDARTLRLVYRALEARFRNCPREGEGPCPALLL